MNVTLTDLIEELGGQQRILGKFQKVCDSICATIRATLRSKGKYTMHGGIHCVDLLHLPIRVEGNTIDYNPVYNESNDGLMAQGRNYQSDTTSEIKFKQLLTGRKPSDKKLNSNVIYKWSIQRGINENSDGTPMSDADRKWFAIKATNMINKQGTQQYRGVKPKLEFIFDSNMAKLQNTMDMYAGQLEKKIVENEIKRIDNNLSNDNKK